jgi:hypothetical protein
MKLQVRNHHNEYQHTVLVAQEMKNGGRPKEWLLDPSLVG